MKNTFIRGASIPKKLNYYNRQADSVKTSWSDLTDETMTNLTVIPSWAVPSDNLKSNETAREWALTINYTDRDENGRHQQIKIDGDCQLEEDNIPRDGYIIAAMVHRSEGGRAYKVVDYKNRYFDLREDALFDIMANGTIEKGIIQDKLIWCTINGGTKLFRVGSKMYEQIKFESELNSQQKKISVKDLIVGHVYATKSGIKSVYIGKHSYQAIEQFKEEVEVPNPYYTYFKTRQTVYVDKVVDYPTEHTFIDVDDDFYTNKYDQHYLKNSQIRQVKSPNSFIFTEGKLDKFVFDPQEVENFIITILKKEFSEKETLYQGFGENGSIYSRNHYRKEQYSNQDYIANFESAIKAFARQYYKMFTLDGNIYPFVTMSKSSSAIHEWGVKHDILNVKRLR